MPLRVQNQWLDCHGVKSAKKAWTVTAEKKGRFWFGANARDVDYPTVGEAHQASEGAGLARAVILVTE